MRKRHLVVIAAMLCLPMFAHAAEPDPEIVYAEKVLQEAKIETSGTALLQFVRERTLTPGDRAKLADAVRRLGDEDFETRQKAEQQLLNAGRVALPFLRPALRDDDAERVSRAKRCIEQIESQAEISRIAAVVRVLGDRKPDGAVAALLAYLPQADGESVEDAVFQALLALGTKDGKADPALVKALKDEEPLRRAAAAHVLARRDPEQRAAVRKLLEDTEPRVRFEAALGLAYVGDKESVPGLVALLGKGPMRLAWKAQEILYRIAGEKAPALALTDDDGPMRAKVAEAWSAWWKDAGANTDLTKIDLAGALRGINLICQEANGNKPARVWACRADGKPLWEIQGVTAWDAHLLPNGHVLIAERGGDKQVTERDVTGKIIMSVKLAQDPGACQRLANGNTLIATSSEITEVDPKGTKLWTFSEQNGGWIARAQRLRNGNILYASEGHKLIEMNAEFKQLRTAEVVKNGDMWMSVEQLSADRFLIAPYRSNKVMEIDSAGKVLWECATQTPMSALRLPNGNTLVGSNMGKAVIEYDRGGKEVWKLEVDGNVRCVRRY
jgi:hypothetical protein